MGSRRLHLVRKSLAVRSVDHEVPGVDVALIAHAAHQVVALVHAVREAEQNLVRLRLVVAQEGPALQVRRRLDAGQAQHRRGEVDESDQAVRAAAGLVVRRRQVAVLLGNRDDQRHAEPGLERCALAARQPRAVVAPVEDDRVVEQARRLHLGQALTGHAVHLGQFVVVLRPVLPHLRRVRVVGGHPHRRWIVDRRMRPPPDLALVGHGEVEDGEERSAFRPVPPVRLAGRFVPNGALTAGLGQVVVLLRVVRRVVAGLAEQLREEPEALGQPGLAAHVLGAGRDRVEAADDRGAGRRAHGRGRPGVAVDQAPGGEPVEVRGRGEGVAVGAKLGSVVLARDPENVRRRQGIRRLGSGWRNAEHQGGECAQHGYTTLSARKVSISSPL